MGCERSGVPLVAEHTGSTSMSSGGCDPAVMPTLIDRQTDEVIVDSKRICFYLDELVPNSRKLRPPMLQVAIDAELAIVDGLPNYQMLTGSPVGTDLRPQRLRDNDGIKAGVIALVDRHFASTMNAAQQVVTKSQVLLR